MNAKDHLKRGWITAGSCENLWGTTSTYRYVPSSNLPPVGTPSEYLDWLRSLDGDLQYTIQENSTLGCPDSEITCLESIVSKAAELGLKLPDSFLLFMRDQTLHRLVPTCTDCFLSLSDLIPLPSLPGHFTLRFLNDPQSCYLWYLCLNQDSDSFVFASPHFFDPEIFKIMEYEDVEYNDLLSTSFLCGDSFTEFLYRFWIENAIWFATWDGFDLPAELRAYSNHAIEHPLQ